jgi:GMP synthase-like glutamine amidotransferase
VSAVRVLLIANRGDEDPGYVGDALRERGAELVTVLREDPQPLPGPVGYDAVVSLGSEWSVYWPHVAAEVGREEDLLRCAVGVGVPVLGICFGGQILAHALGGAVTRAATAEIGWYQVESDVPALLPPGPYVQWHSDRFVPPPGSVELARSPAGCQAFVLGGALGLQFHPEATPAVVRRWVQDMPADLTDPAQAAAFAAQSDDRDSEAGQRARTIVDTFLSGALAEHARALSG